jgi:MFS family permease
VAARFTVRMTGATSSAFTPLCALATGPLFLVLARAAQGIGGAIMFATSLALPSDHIVAGLRGTPLAARAHGKAAAVGEGQSVRALGALPPAPGGLPPRSPARRSPAG